MTKQWLAMVAAVCCVVAGTAALSGCGGGGGIPAAIPVPAAGGPLSADFFPLNAGDRHTYRVTSSSGGQSFLRIRTGTQRSVDGVNVIPLEELDDQNRVRRVQFVRVANGAFEIIGEDRLDPATGAVLQSIRFAPPQSYPFNSTFDQTFTVTSENAETTTEVTLLPFETMTVHAGTFPNAARLRIRTTSGTGGQITEVSRWFAAGVGEIRSVLSSGGSVVSAELIFASVGGRTYGDVDATAAY